MSVAYCCMMHDEEDFVFWQLKYFYDVGIRDFFIMYNTADDLTQIYVHAFRVTHPDANIRTVHETERGRDRMVLRKNILYRMAGHEGFEWILPLDADEIITPVNPKERKNFNLVELLETDFAYAKSGDFLRFAAYHFIPTQEDDYAEINPVLRINHRQAQVGFRKTIWRYSDDSHSMVGAHNNSGTPITKGRRPMTAHYGWRSPIQIVKKLVAAAQSASHQYGKQPDFKAGRAKDMHLDPPNDYTGLDIAKSHEYFERVAGEFRYLTKHYLARKKLQDLANCELVKENIWLDTFS